MKKIILVLIFTLIFSILVLLGCNRAGSSMNGSGKIVDDDLNLEGFSSLNIQGPFEVEVNQSKDFKVTLSTDDNLVSRVQVSMERRTLKLSIEAPATFFPTALKLKVEMPVLATLTLSDAADAAVNGFNDAGTFSAFLSGKSILHCTTEVSYLELNVSGASEAVFEGKSQTTVVDAQGASKLDLSGFESTSANVRMTESSQAIMNVSGLIDITLDKESKFYYMGNPIFRNTDVSGGSTMSHK